MMQTRELLGKSMGDWMEKENEGGSRNNYEDDGTVHLTINKVVRWQNSAGWGVGKEKEIGWQLRNGSMAMKAAGNMPMIACFCTLEQQMPQGG